METNLLILKNALVAQTTKNDIISNNLANIDNVGFKKEQAFFEMISNKMKSDTKLNVKTNFQQGRLDETNNSLDLAISGRGFFVVETEADVAYTRDGHFKLDEDGVLKTSGGNAVLGDNGAIVLISDGLTPKEIVISKEGEIFVDGDLRDKIYIADFENMENMKKIGGNLFSAGEDMREIDTMNAEIKQGFLEKSNVNPVEEMMGLIEVQRQFESTQKMIKSLDATIKIAVNRIGDYR